MGTCACVLANSKQRKVKKSRILASSVGEETKNSSKRNSITMWAMPLDSLDLIDKQKMQRLKPLNLHLSELFSRRQSRRDQ